MKIVQINTVCGTGSTGKIVVDLYHIAEREGHETYVAYGRGKASADIQGVKIGNIFDFGCHVLINFFLGKSGFGSRKNTRRFLKWLDKIEPDILHLHNLHGFYIHVGLLFDYIKAHNIPVIWTLHDCWPLTGQCAHFDYTNCDKWQTGCYDCPIYRSDYPYSLFRDNSCQNYLLKKNAFTNVKNMTIVTPSHWLADIVKKSYLQEYPVTEIPNGINLEIFKPADTINTTKKIILGVANVWSQRKGLDYFLQLPFILDDTYQIVLIGLSQKQKSQIKSKYGNRIIAITRTANQAELASWYRRAYVYVNLTLEDTFPTTNLEALACGTPVITFNTGGSPESLTEKCGVVVEKGNFKKIKEAILSLDEKTEITSLACRTRAMEYDREVRFREYFRLYEFFTQENLNASSEN